VYKSQIHEITEEIPADKGERREWEKGPGVVHHGRIACAKCRERERRKNDREEGKKPRGEGEGEIRGK